MVNTHKTSPSKNHILRRATALCLALFGLWLLGLAMPGTTLLQSLGSNARVVSAALTAQLGSGAATSDKAASRPAWAKLLLGESALLANWQEKGEQTLDSEGNETDDGDNPPPATQNQIVEKSFKVTDEAGYARADDVYILNRTELPLDVAAVAAMSPGITLNKSDAPQILIMHTHGSEAYTQDGNDVYEESGTARTTDLNYNIIRVGDEIERIFTEMGFSVLHDRTLYDYPDYNGAYDRSREAVKRYMAENPSIQIVLDVHRDALVGQDGTVYKPVAEIDGAKTAQILFVMGSNDGGLDHPNWQNNLSLSMRMQHRMNMLWPGLARPINLRASRFNQQLSKGSVLVEVGAHGNTLQEALAGARLFARSAGQVLQELQE